MKSASLTWDKKKIFKDADKTFLLYRKFECPTLVGFSRCNFESRFFYNRVTSPRWILTVNHVLQTNANRRLQFFEYTLKFIAYIYCVYMFASNINM